MKSKRLNFESLSSDKFAQLAKTQLTAILGGTDGQANTDTGGGVAYANGHFINATSDCMIQDKNGFPIHVEYWKGDGTSEIWEPKKA